VTHRIWRRSNDPVFGVAAALVVVAVLAAATASARRSPQARTPFAAQIASLSETGGYFDTDNLISNERSYLTVLSDLDKFNVRGGAYVGVGPDQNFSYIAHVRPAVAFIIDIRRDNLLLHLLFKALFEQARTRVEYLSLLFGRPVPSDIDSWRNAPVARLAEYVDRSQADPKAVDALRSRLDVVIKSFGVPLTSEDMATIDRFHRRFIDAGLALQFQSFNRYYVQNYYPTYADLLLGTDKAGRQAHYLASEDAFQFLKSLQSRDRVIPVVGDLSGPTALASIGHLLADRGETLSAFYASNVEFYLQRQGAYQRFVSNLGRLPHTNRSVIIRSVFNRGIGGSESEIQAVEDVLKQFAVNR
jgi:hypothetical protein